MGVPSVSPIRASVRVCEGRGRGRWEARSSASFVYLLSSLQLELVRPGSWRKSLRPPRRRPQTRRAVSGAGREEGRRQGDRVRWRWKRPGVEARAVRDGGETRAARGRGRLLGRKLLPPRRSPPPRIPGLASVPRSHRHLQPPAPAHVGPEAGGAPGTLSLIPRLLRGDPQPCRWVAAGAALCCPWVEAGAAGGR